MPPRTRRRRAALFALLALGAVGTGCGAGSDEPAGAGGAPGPPAVTYLRPDQWPSGAPFGPWAQVGPVRLDGGSAEGALLPLICGEVEFPAGSGVRAYAAGGFDRADERPAAPEAAADQYVSVLADDVAAQEKLEQLVRQFRTCVGEIGSESFQEYPRLEVADGARIFGRFITFPDGRFSSKLFAFGRVGRLISIEVLNTGDRRKAAPRTAFRATVRTAMEQLRR